MSEKKPKDRTIDQAQVAPSVKTSEGWRISAEGGLINNKKWILDKRPNNPTMGKNKGSL